MSGVPADTKREIATVKQDVNVDVTNDIWVHIEYFLTTNLIMSKIDKY
jgi:hypothetical protein|tara:strand:+ start:68 stop:211 length:144 start_codon:yes stop_codon:yes gene_type:complete